jgi:hypothetical protein
MQRMQRKVQGTFKKGTADDAQVGMLIHDFEAADKMLETVLMPYFPSISHRPPTNL